MTGPLNESSAVKSNLDVEIKPLLLEKWTCGDCIVSKEILPVADFVWMHAVAKIMTSDSIVLDYSLRDIESHIRRKTQLGKVKFFQYEYNRPLL